MKRLFQLFKYKLPLYKRKVWYNFHVHSNKNYPVVFDSKGEYIQCEVGKKLLMGKTACGKSIYYKVTNYWQERPGSDWLYSSDSINCDMIFSHVE